MKPDGGDAVDEYVVSWNDTNAAHSDIVRHELGNSAYEYEIKKLIPGQYYSVTILTKNSEGSSKGSPVLQNTCK